MDWISGINQALRYIEDNICEDFVVEDISKHIYLSASHFQRVFNILTGITVGEYVRNRRLSLAGSDLANKGAKVIDTALKFSYDSPESFTKAFTRFHGITPTAAKKDGAILRSFVPIVIKLKLEGGSFMDYSIQTKDKFDVFGMKRTFTLENSQTEIPNFWKEYYEKGYGKVACGVFGICHEAEGDSFNYSIADPYKEGQEIPEGFEKFTIPAATWAVFKCVGPMPNAIQDMWHRVYSEWLPTSDYEIVPCFDIEMYTNGDSTSADYVSEIWIAVKKKG